MTTQLSKIKNFFTKTVVAICVLLVPAYTQAQDAPPPPNNGGNPDNHTLAVPYDNNMNLLFFAVGIILAVVVFKKIQKQRLAKA